MRCANPFKYKGPLDPGHDSMITITREEELNEIMKGISNQTYYALIAPRQMGKTTLLFQLIHDINNLLDDTIGIYITLEDLVNIDSVGFYQSFVRKFITFLSSKFDIHPSSLREKAKEVRTNLDLKDFFLEMAKATLSHPSDSDDVIKFEKREGKKYKFVLMVDEVGAIPEDSIVEFVKTIRSIFIERLSMEGFKAYSIILCGAADLATLTYGKTSPFNISKVIQVRDFGFEEIYTWITDIFNYLGIVCDDSFYEQFFLQTQGHPYLSQMLCSKMIEKCEREGRNKISSADLTEAINNAVNGDINLLTVLEKITKDVLMKEMLLKILNNEPVPYSRAHTIIYNLQLSGAIRKKDTVCVVKNPIYEKFFRHYFNL
ncbi:MAG: AAA-like domain-containing protein [bacterium]